MNNSEMSAETTAEKSGADETTTSSHSSANTIVGGSLSNYRIVKETNNMCTPPHTTYLIEKRRTFLFWSWWSRAYVMDGSDYGCFNSNSLQTIKQQYEVLIGNKEWYEKQVVS